MPESTFVVLNQTRRWCYIQILSATKLPPQERTQTFHKQPLHSKYLLARKPLENGSAASLLPDIKNLNRIAEILGVDLNYFSESFTSNETRTAPDEPQEESRGFFVNIKTNLGLNWNLSGEAYVDPILRYQQY